MGSKEGRGESTPKELAEQRKGDLKQSRASLVGLVEEGFSHGADLQCWQQLNGWQTGVLAA